MRVGAGGACEDVSGWGGGGGGCGGDYLEKCAVERAEPHFSVVASLFYHVVSDDRSHCKRKRSKR